MDQVLSAAALYDLRTRGITSDLAAIVSLTRGLRVLEVGCGTGRVMRALLAAGCSRVVGVELDAEKCHFGQAALADVLVDGASEMVHGDFLSFDPQESFDIVLFSFNVFEEFTTVALRIAALKQAARLLSKGGGEGKEDGGHVLLFNSAHDYEALAAREVDYAFSIGDQSDDNALWDVRINGTRDHLAQTSACAVRYCHRGSGAVVMDHYVRSFITRNELLATYAAAGLRVDKEFGGYDFSPVSEESTVLIHLLARS